MEINLFPEEMKGLNLATFSERIVTVAFGLTDEIRLKGKEAVFAQFPCPEQMAKNAEKTLDEMYEVCAYALRRVFGDLGPENDERVLSARSRTLDSCFRQALSLLSGKVLGESGGIYRRALIGDSVPWKCDSGAMADGVKLDVAELGTRVEQLMSDVRFYDQKRDEALAEIRALLTEIKAQDNLPKLPDGTDALEARKVDALGSITQIHWPYRSQQILWNAGMKSLTDAAQYFGDFWNFAQKEKTMTLWEWAVIVAILRREGVLPEAEHKAWLESEVTCLMLGTRTKNSLHRAKIVNIQDLMSFFAEGPDAGWEKMQRVRGAGSCSIREMVETLCDYEIVIPDELCFPTLMSGVLALDFDQMMMVRLKKYQIMTVGELLVACQDENRFTGLRYVDQDLYKRAMIQLKTYGFIE